MRAAAQLQATIELLDTITETRYPADRVMSQYFRDHRYIGSKDKAAISEQLYTVLRNKLSYSYLLEQAGLDVRSRTLTAVFLQSENLNISDYFNGERYSPASLSGSDQSALESIDFSKLESAPLHVQLNVPEWVSDKLQVALGARFEQEMRASNQRASTDIRVNTLKSTTNQVDHQLQQAGYNAEQAELSPWGLKFNSRVALFNLDAFRQGWFEVQDEGSQLLAFLTGVKAGDRVVDFCAGAGGKTLALAAMMQNKGTIYACDVHSKRLEQTTKRAKRAGAHNIRTHVLSSEKDKWVKQHAGKADVVLIDAPCTGTGTWRRSPDSRWNLTETDLNELVQLQQSILQSASRLLKPGGRLFYATCSLLKEENESQVEAFVENNPNFSYSNLVIEEPLKSNLDKIQFNHYELRTLPALSDTDGFYVCALESA